MNIKISRKNIVPLSEQLANQIKQCILKGEWLLGSMLPSELEFQKELGLSRSTVRIALKDVEKDGLIVTAPGKGRFVQKTTSMKENLKFIGYITENLQQSFHYEMLKGAESVAGKEGYKILFFHTDNDSEMENKYLNQMIEENVKGFLIYPMQHRLKSDVLLRLIEKREMPIVTMDRKFENVKSDTVGCDNFEGSYKAVQYLIEQGHKKIVFLARPILDLLPVQQRYDGYKKAMIDAGITPLDPWMVGENQKEVSSTFISDPENTTFMADIEQINALIGRNDLPTAIFAMHDGMAFLFYKAIKDTKIRIPDDISIIGFNNNSELCDFFDLTTVNQNTYEIGETAMQFLINRINGDTSPFQTLLTKTDLKIRSSVKKLG